MKQAANDQYGLMSPPKAAGLTAPSFNIEIKDLGIKVTAIAPGLPGQTAMAGRVSQHPAALFICDIQRRENIQLYTAKTHTTGRRGGGSARSSDGRLDTKRARA